MRAISTARVASMGMGLCGAVGGGAVCKGGSVRSGEGTRRFSSSLVDGRTKLERGRESFAIGRRCRGARQMGGWNGRPGARVEGLETAGCVEGDTEVTCEGRRKGRRTLVRVNLVV